MFGFEAFFAAGIFLSFLLVGSSIILSFIEKERGKLIFVNVPCKWAVEHLVDEGRLGFCLC